jgi:O-antigen/teichoic acid export membrane protein
VSDPGPAEALEARRQRLKRRAGGSLRSFAAGGMAVNAAWSIGLQGMAFLRGFLVAIFLAPSDYGVWSIIVLGYTALGRLKQVGIGDKYIQQDDPDDEAAFQKAFTLEAIMTGGMVVLLAAATPLLALIYRAPQIVLPGLVLLVSLIGGIFQTPVWAYTRDMDFRRQRRLSAVDPIMGVVGTVVSAAAGLGYWSFAIGSFVGAWSGALVVMRNAPYPIRLRYDRGSSRY